MRCLVTGGLGFIGSNLVDRLIRDGHEVTVIDNLSTGKRENLNPAASFVQASIEDYHFDQLEQQDVVFHLAALARIQPSIADPVAFHRANVLGSLRVFKAAVDWGARVVFSSSSSIYGDAEHLPVGELEEPNPASPYALQKLICEQYLKLFADLYGLQAIALRWMNILLTLLMAAGAYAAVVGIFMAQHAAGVPFTIVGDGEQRRDFTYVGDVVEGNVKAATVPARDTGRPNFEVVNIGTGNNTSMNELAAAISQEHPREYLAERKGEARETRASIGKAVAMLEWHPTVAIEDWIKKTMGKAV